MAETFWNWFNPLKWYWKTLVLIFFWPIIIPIYAWTKTDWPSPVKWIVSLVTAFMFIGLAAAQTSPPPTKDLPEPVPPASTTPQITPKKSAPKITFKTIEVTESVPFVEERTQDPNLEKGQSQVRQEGATGVKTFVYKVQLKDDVEETRTLEKDFVSIAPAPKIIADGTKEPPPPPPPQGEWDPNYTGHVPIASDVDCAGGSGNGPAYVQGPVRVIGADIYDLDRDGDGICCE